MKSLIHWLAFAALISRIRSAAVMPLGRRVLSTSDSSPIISPEPLGIEREVKVIPDSTLNSHFVIGGWDSSFSNLTFVRKRAEGDAGPNVTLGVPTGIDIHCHAGRYGIPSRFSCGNAFVDIPEDRDRDTLGARTTPGHWDVPLPFRFVSSNGRCVIEFDIANPGVSDRASGLELRDATYKILKQCVIPLRQGGTATGVGEHRQLNVVVKATAPQVKCEAPATPYQLSQRAYCQQVLNAMPASTALGSFGLQAMNAKVALPVTFVDASQRCKVTVDIDGPPMLSRWYDVWGAACSAVGVCTVAGEEGTSIIESTNVARGRSRIIVKVEAGPGTPSGAPSVPAVGTL